MRTRVVGLTLWVVACGGGSTSDLAQVAATSTGTSSGGASILDGMEADIPWRPLPDLPPEDRSCEERGTKFGVVAGPQVIEGAFDPVAIDHVSLAAGYAGLLLTYSRYNPNVATGDYLAVRVSLDGSAKGQSWSLAISNDAPSGFSEDDRMLLTYCQHGVAGWRAFDAAGAPQGPALLPPSYEACPGYAPAAAWLPTGYLAAWPASSTYGCDGGCLAVAFGNEDIVFNGRVVAPTFVVTDPIAISAASQTALVVASQINPEGGNELVLVLVDDAGVPMFPPIKQPIPQLGDGPATHVPVAVSTTADDGFLVVVGGRGNALGRMRLDDVASVVEPYADVALPAGLAGVDAFRSAIELSPRLGGHVAHGRAHADAPLLLLLMLDDDGTIHSYEQFPNAADAGVASLEGRTWVAYGGDTLSLAELGCVF